jgi:CheY-like chemotaxis protein
MNTREALNEISDLQLGGMLERMPEGQLSEYWRALNSFTDIFPSKEEELKNALASKDYRAYAKCLAGMRDLLQEIHATKLADECKTHLDGLTNIASIRHEKLEAFMNYSLANIAVLSIDIQMAHYKTLQQTEAAPPADAAGQPAPDAAAAAPAAAPRQDGVKTILAVDDQTFYHSALRAYLKGTEYHLTCSHSGADALNHIKNNSPSLFILDIMMPEMDGYELAQKIREAGHTAPIIFLTGTASSDAVVSAIKAGGSDFIVKPASREQVLARVTKFI